jgi:hypothetical protein
MKYIFIFLMIFMHINSCAMEKAKDKQSKQKDVRILPQIKSKIDVARFEFLNLQSKENQELKALCEKHPIFTLPPLRAVVLDYVGSDMIVFQTLRTSKLGPTYNMYHWQKSITPYLGYFPVHVMSFYYDGSGRPWLKADLKKEVHLNVPCSDEECKRASEALPFNGSLSWHVYTGDCIAQDNVADTYEQEPVDMEKLNGGEKNPLVVKLSSKTDDGIFHATLSQYQHNSPVVQHKATVSVDRTALLRAILNGKPEIRGLTNPKPDVQLDKSKKDQGKKKSCWPCGK